MTWLVVTPARNEVTHLGALAASLAAQTRPVVGRWVIVDDASSDGTGEFAARLDVPFPVTVVRRSSPGGLARGSAFSAFLHGADLGLELLPSARRVMKCDADLTLDPHFLAVLDEAPDSVGLTGGRIAGTGEREQVTYVSGQVKCYSRAAFDIVKTLPVAVGWDVVDEVAVRRGGLEVRADLSVAAYPARRTGSSEGILSGRARGGKVSRWTGYHPAYFALRVVRHLFRRPVVVGGLAMAWGYARAGAGPFDASLRSGVREAQVAKLGQLARHPVRWLRATYAPPLR